MLLALAADPATSAPVSSKGRTEDFESSNRGSNPRAGTSHLTAGDSRGNGPAEDVAKSSAPAGRYQSGTSASMSVSPPDRIGETYSARMSTVARLAGELASLAAAGDIEGVRLVHETIGRLVAPARSAEEGPRGAVVIDLEAERERRTGCR
jgi:hypothetical protein